MGRCLLSGRKVFLLHGNQFRVGVAKDTSLDGLVATALWFVLSIIHGILTQCK